MSFPDNADEMGADEMALVRSDIVDNSVLANDKAENGNNQRDEKSDKNSAENRAVKAGGDDEVKQPVKPKGRDKRMKGPHEASAAAKSSQPVTKKAGNQPTVVRMVEENESDDDDGDLPDIVDIKAAASDGTASKDAAANALKASPKKRGRPAKIPQNGRHESGRGEAQNKRRRHSKVFGDMLMDDEEAVFQKQAPSAKLAQEGDEAEPEEPARRGRGRPRKSTPVPKSSAAEVKASQESPLKRKSHRVKAAETHASGRPVRAAAESAKVSMTEQSSKKFQAVASTSSMMAAKRDEVAKPARKGRKQSVYEVEKIMGYRFDKNTGDELYLIKWAGFPDSDNTWEPLENLKGCRDKLSSFLTSQGKDKKQKNSNKA